MYGAFYKILKKHAKYWKNGKIYAEKLGEQLGGTGTCYSTPNNYNYHYFRAVFYRYADPKR